jgi:hypothetical protein
VDKIIIKPNFGNDKCAYSDALLLNIFLNKNEMVRKNCYYTSGVKCHFLVCDISAFGYASCIKLHPRQEIIPFPPSSYK